MPRFDPKFHTAAPAYYTVTATHSRAGRTTEARTVSAADLPGYLRQLDREGAGYTKRPAVCEECHKAILTPERAVVAYSGKMPNLVEHVYRTKCWREGDR